MSTYSTDTELPEEPDDQGSTVDVSGSPVDRLVRLDLYDRSPHRAGLPDVLETEFYCTPAYARQLAAALLRQADWAERYTK